MRIRLLPTQKLWRRVILGVVGIATLIACMALFIAWHGRWAWERYRKQSLARGVKLEFREWAPALIPDEENFGAAPILQELFSSDPKVRSNARASCKLPAEVGNIWHNKHDDFEEMQTAFLQLGWITTATGNPAEDVLTALERYEPLLNPLRAAMAKPGNRLILKRDKDNTDTFYSALGLYTLSRVLTLRIWALLDQGQTGKAMADWLLQRRLASVLESEPTSIILVSKAFLSSEVVNTVEAGLTLHRWQESELVEFESQLGRIDLMAGYAFALASDRALLNDLIDGLKAQPYATSPTSFPAILAANGWNMRLLATAPDGWFDYGKLKVNQWFDEQLAKDASDTAPRSLNTAERFISRQRAILTSYYSPFTPVAASTIRGALSLAQRVQTRVQLCRIAIALERNRLRHDTYPPEDLHALGDLSALSKDAFGNPSPFYKKLSSTQFLLYSAGRNRHDDGGQGDDQHWP